MSTTHYITANQGGLNTGTGDTTYEAQGVVITSGIDMRYQSDDTTFNGGGSQVVYINGGVFGDIDDTAATSGNDQIFVGSTGYVEEARSYAIDLEGGGNSITNSGTIASTVYSRAILILGDDGADQGDGDAIVNSGTISGSTQVGEPGYAVIDCLATASLAITNSGSILAGGGASGMELVATGAVSIDNSGLITGGMSVEGADGYVSLTNTGTINGSTIVSATGSQGPSQSHIFNHGQMNGDLSLAGGDVVRNSGTIDGSITEGAGDCFILNFGEINGGLDLAGGDTVFNKGALEGVSLGNGTNVFNGVGGTVDFEIYGGSGADTIRLGNDGETVEGGLGHDKLYGGTGADTFAFSYDGTANADRIFNFGVNNDTIELYHSTFTTLVRGSAPVLGIGTKATSTSDHLFYNNVGGGLWYDRDGSGTTYAAVEIANLGPGLKLTAGNFEVT